MYEEAWGIGGSLEYRRRLVGSAICPAIVRRGCVFQGYGRWENTGHLLWGCTVWLPLCGTL